MPDPRPPSSADTTTATATPPDACPSCGHARTGRFCGHCGEKRVEPEDLTLRRILGDAIATALDVDASLPRTLRTLVANPGRLTVDFMKGRRQGRLGPFQLFLALNVVFFIVQSITGWNTLRSPLHIQFGHPLIGDLARSLVEAEVAARAMTLEEYAATFDAMVDLQAKSLVVIMVPIFAIVVHGACGLWRRRYAVESVVFSLHFLSFFLLLASVVFPVVEGGRAFLARAGLEVPDPALDAALSIALAAVWFLYLRAAVARVYALRRWAGTAAAIGLTTGFIATILGFRASLFFTSFLAV